MLETLPTQRDLFDLPREVAYLNAASRGPFPRRSAAAGEAALARARHPWTIGAPDFFTETEQARGLVARLLHADAEGVAVIPATSYGLAAAAANLGLRKRRRIITVADEFPSNVYIWRRLAAEQGGEVVTIEAGEDGDLTAAVLAAIDERCALAALPNCRWTDGSLLDLAAIGQRLRGVGARLVVDLTQSLGALPFDAAPVRPDFVVAASYKWLLGPYSLGWLWVAPEHREGRPLEENWIARTGSEDFARLVDYQAPYQPGARRFDVGERSNFVLMPIAIASLEQILEWGVEAIARTLQHRTRAIAARATALGLSAAPDAFRAGHYLGLQSASGLPTGLVEQLAADGVYVSQRGHCLRVTPHLYNDDEDIEHFFTALAGALRS